MRQKGLVAIVLAVSAATWLLLEHWLPSRSERFYLLVPPTFLALFWIVTERPLDAIRQHRRIFGLFVGGTLVAYTMVVMSVAGSGSLFKLGTYVEYLCVAYFFVALLIVLVLFHRVLARGMAWLGARLPRGSWRRFVVCDVVPALLFVIGAAPFVMALTYVHRIKFPLHSMPDRDLGRPYEDVAFQTRDGVTIRGWFVPAPKPSKTTFVVCHGLGLNRCMCFGWTRLTDIFDANVLMFDFRGHGSSDGHTVTIGSREKEDVLAAIAFVRREKPEFAEKLYGLGISMGSAALIGAGAEVDVPLDGYFVDSGFASAMDLTDTSLRFVPAPLRAWLTVPGIPLVDLHTGYPIAEHRPENLIGKLRAPVFISHSETDALIPVSHAHRLYRNAQEPKQLYTVDQAGHGCVFFANEPAYLESVRAFYTLPAK